ncbi:MAG TPA: M48 family metalloprotease [Terracidiphilus sp.]|jgi:hypothetical protein
MRNRLLVISLLSAAAAFCQESDPASRIVEKMVANEQEFLTKIKTLQPFLETYIQEFSDDGDNVLTGDHYMLGRLDLTRGVGQNGIAMSAGFQKRSRSKNFINFLPTGWAQMILPDANGLSRSVYDFEYSRREFLGDVRCLVFEVSPKDKKAAGKFMGTIWVEDQEFRIVRFNGTYTHSKASWLFFHFDSWRVNVAPGLWAPSFVYVEEVPNAGQPAARVRFKAQTRLWGYYPVTSSKLDELSDVLIESKAPVVDKSGSDDVTPVESQRRWEEQAEKNVILRLERSSLLSPKGELDQVLNTVVNNLMATNHINIDVQCRVLLTTPFETFSIGHTIVISRGLVDVLPDEASLAMVLAEELAHIALAHRTATTYAFGDRIMFDDTELLKKMHLTRTPEEMEAAGAKAVELLSNSPYADKLGNAGLFLKALASRMASLPSLVQANLGNQFANASNMARLEELVKKAPPLEENKIEQIAALPIGSRIKLDVWTNQITLIKTSAVTFLSAREKMPFEVTPLSFHLVRIGSRPVIASQSPAASKN